MTQSSSIGIILLEKKEGARELILFKIKQAPQGSKKRNQYHILQTRMFGSAELSENYKNDLRKEQ